MIRTVVHDFFVVTDHHIVYQVAYRTFRVVVENNQTSNGFFAFTIYKVVFSNTTQTDNIYFTNFLQIDGDPQIDG